jgi:hypothetical protein
MPSMTPHDTTRSTRPDSIVLAGGGGALGSAVLEQLLARSGHARVGVLVTQPLKATMRRLVPIRWPGADELRRFNAASAVIVFDRERTANGRELGMLVPSPDELPSFAATLQDAGVSHLLVVLPHDAAGWPVALRAGLATLDEQAVASLGFEHLVIMRPADTVRAPREPALLPRVARWMLQQLRLMVPQTQQPVRNVKIAAFAAEIARRLPQSQTGTRVVAPELVWLASQNVDQGDIAERWLAGEALPQITPARQRM